jgi:hypothetical protein
MVMFEKLPQGLRGGACWRMATVLHADPSGAAGEIAWMGVGCESSAGPDPWRRRACARERLVAISWIWAGERGVLIGVEPGAAGVEGGKLEGAEVPTEGPGTAWLEGTRRGGGDRGRLRRPGAVAPSASAAYPAGRGFACTLRAAFGGVLLASCTFAFSSRGNGSGGRCRSRLGTFTVRVNHTHEPVEI